MNNNNPLREPGYGCKHNEVSEFNKTKCNCAPGFKYDENLICQPNHIGNFIIYPFGKDLYKIPTSSCINNTKSKLFYTNQCKNYDQGIVTKCDTIFMDNDCIDGKIYTLNTAISEDVTLTRIPYNGSNVENLVTLKNNKDEIESLAIDWISRIIFWINKSDQSVIKVAHLEIIKTSTIILINNKLIKASNIHVHPGRGKIFWLNSQEKKKLEWANEDGSDHKIFLPESDNDVEQFAIDVTSDKLCWSDGKIDGKIVCADIETKNITVIIENLNYPYKIAVFKDVYFWIHHARQDTQCFNATTKQVHSLMNLPHFYKIHLVPEYCPSISNLCRHNNGGCRNNQLCLPKGQESVSCNSSFISPDLIFI